MVKQRLSTGIYSNIFEPLCQVIYLDGVNYPLDRMALELDDSQYYRTFTISGGVWKPALLYHNIDAELHH